MNRYYNPIIERASREELLALQWKRLKYQLEYQYNNNPFYRSLFKKNGVIPEKIRNIEEFRERVPLLTKEECLKDQVDFPPYGLRLGVSRDKIVRTWLTSGSSGKGQEVYGVTTSDFKEMCMWRYIFHWGGLKRGDAMMTTLPIATHLAGSDSIINSAVRAGANSFNLGPFSTEEKLRFMMRFRPNIIFGTFNYINVLGIKANEMGIHPKRDFPDLKFILTANITPNINLVPKVEEFWGTKVIEFYGSTQIGSAGGGTCEKGAFYNGNPGIIHFLEHLNLIEVLDRENRKPVEPGEEGELVITNLYKEGSPLIRFATNDRVKYMPHYMCSCKRPFDGIEAGFVYRYDDMMKIKGVNIWPEAIENIIFSYDETVDYRGRVIVDGKGAEKVILTVEFKKGVLDEKKMLLLERFYNEIYERIGIKMEVEETEEPLPKFDFKPRRWSDERGGGVKRVIYTTQ